MSSLFKLLMHPDTAGLARNGKFITAIFECWLDKVSCVTFGQFADWRLFRPDVVPRKQTCICIVKYIKERKHERSDLFLRQKILIIVNVILHFDLRRSNVRFWSYSGSCLLSERHSKMCAEMYKSWLIII